MKTMKKIASIALALVLALALCVPALAAQPNKEIKLSNATAGSTYTLYKIFDAEYDATTGSVSYTVEEDSYWYAKIDANAPFSLAQKGDSNDYYVTMTGTDVQVIDWLKANFNGAPAVADSAQTPDADGAITWTPAGYGYYLIKSDTDGDVAVTIDSNTPSVTVIAKNEKPGWGDNGGKTVNGEALNSANLGDTLNFSIVMDGAKNYDGQEVITKYVVHDEMSQYLSLDEDSITVKVNGTTVTATFIDEPNDDCTFEIEIAWTNAAGEFLYTEVNNEIEVTYTATVAETAPANTALSNKANITWNNKTTGTPEDETKTFVYDFDLNKVDNENHALTGAKFTLENESGDAVEFVAVDGGYRVAVETDTNTTTTIEAGSINVTGLAAGTYSLTETEAPNGYNKLADSIAIVITAGTDGAKSMTQDGEAVDSGAIVVVNQTGATLPSTGGIGTTIFYVGGSLLVAAAAILLITKKRMSVAD